MELPTHTDITEGAPRKGIPAFRLIEDQLNQVRQLINEQLIVPAKAAEINRLLEYIKTRSGKMIRPALVLLSYHAVHDASAFAGASLPLRGTPPCGNPKQGCEKNTQYTIHNTQYEATCVAAIVEMIHNATLLHDDVIDEGQKRRGLPTINSLWGNESAVLLGDFLLSQVFKMCTDLEPKITNIIAAAATRTCEGELRQVIQRHNWQTSASSVEPLSESEYIDIITEKSAAFFSSCCHLGALLAQAAETEVESLARFGLNAGIAFQITDDLLDLIGDESQTGKTVGSDVNKNKLTLAIIHLLTVVDQKEKSKLYNKLNRSVGTSRKALLKMLKSYNSLEYAYSRAREFVDKAMQALTGLKQSQAKEALIETAKFMANRVI